MRLRAHAKVTLGLRVRQQRPDSYHDIESLVVFASEPVDELEIDMSSRHSFEVEGTVHGVPEDSSNLVIRALEILGKHVGRQLTTSATLYKEISPAAGLGGGSADAAAALHGANELFSLGLTTSDLAAIGAEIGSDVPVCTLGRSAWMRGRGEKIEPVNVGTFSFLVAVPPYRMNTTNVYEAYREHAEPGRVVLAPDVLRSHCTELINDLEPAAVALEPRLATFRDHLLELTNHQPLMVGSGSAYVVFGSFSPHQRSQISEETGALIWQSETTPSCVEIRD